MNLQLPKDLCNPEMQHFMFADAWFSGVSASWSLTHDSTAKEDQWDLCLVCVIVNLWVPAACQKLSLQTQI